MTDRPTEHNSCRPTVGSLFSGIGGFDLGFQRAGFDVLWQVEIEPDAVAVLMRHWPTVRRFRDVNAVVYGQSRNRQKHGLVLPPVDVVVGGFPCQDVSVAGQRRGLAGSRSGLFFAFMRALRLMRAQFNKPDYVVIENVPGLLTSNRGADFHTVLSEVADCGFRRAYRILDSRFFGVAQRRRRVFIVGHRGDSERARAVLFESVGSGGHLAPRRPARPRVAATLRGRAARAGVNTPGRGGEDDSNLICFDWQSGGSKGRLNCSSSSSSSSSSLQTSQTPAVAFTIPSVHRGVGQGHNTTYIAATPNSGGNDGGFRTEPGDHLIVSSSGERARALTASCYKRHDEDTDTLVLGVHANQRGELRTSELAGSLNGSRSGKQYEGIAVASPVTASAGHHGHSSPRGDGRDNLIPISGDALRGAGTAKTLSADAQGKQRLRDPGLGIGQEGDPAFTVTAASPGFTVTAASPGAVGVRRLTPLECERLQGFPDGWTCLCGVTPYSTAGCTCPDTPRYKGLGNAVTVTVANWIARRVKSQIEAVA